MIIEKIYLGTLDDRFRYAEIFVDILIQQTNTRIPNLRAFIDTGAAKCCINESTLSKYIDLKSAKVVEFFSSSGTSTGKEVSDVYIRLNPLMSETFFIPIPSITTCNLRNDFDVILGTNILTNCEFIYNGLSKTYVLKLLTEELE